MQDLKYELNNVSISKKNDTTVDDLPLAAKEVQPASYDDGALIDGHHPVHPQLVHHHLVCCSRCQRQGQEAINLLRRRLAANVPSP